MKNLDRLLEKSRELRENAGSLAWDENKIFYRPVSAADIEPTLVDVPMTWPQIRAQSELPRALYATEEMLTIAVEALNDTDCECYFDSGICYRCEGLKKIEALAAKALGESEC